MALLKKSSAPKATDPKKPGVSKLKLALGAAGLFLFIVGVKRSIQLDDEREIVDGRPRRRRADAAPPADA
jgi:hypothetical protein